MPRVRRRAPSPPATRAAVAERFVAAPLEERLSSVECELEAVKGPIWVAARKGGLEELSRRRGLLSDVG